MSAREQFAKTPASVLLSPSLSDASTRLYGVIVLYAWESSGSDCTATQTTLAKDLGWSRAKTQRAALELIDAGVVTRVYERGKPNRYAPTCLMGEAASPESCLTSEATSPESCLMGEAASGQPASPVRQLPASPVRHEAEAVEAEKGKRYRRRASKARKPTPKQLEKIGELLAETGETARDVPTLDAASAEIDRLIALKRQGPASDPEPEPEWTSISYDSDRIQVRHERHGQLGKAA